MDERNLFPEVFRAMRDVAPRAVVIENVKSLIRGSFRPYVEYVKLQLSMPEIQPEAPERWLEHAEVLRRLTTKSGSNGVAGHLRYTVTKRLLNAVNYGVPQKRQRVFIVAIRREMRPERPELEWRGVPGTHSEDALL